MHVPGSIEVIHTVDSTYTMVNGTIAPHPNLKWYSNSFLNYGIKDWSWAAACQLARALQEFEDGKKTKELPWDQVLMRALNIGRCDTFVRTKPSFRVAKKTSNEQH